MTEADQDHTYPEHAGCGGPFLPTVTGGLICARCKVRVDSPDFGVLGHARRAHKASGDPWPDVRRPPSAKIQALDLSPNERSYLLRIAKPKGKGMGVKPEQALPLVLLGLVQEWKAQGISDVERRALTFDGERVAEQCRTMKRKPEQVLAFALGPEQPRRWKT